MDAPVAVAASQGFEARSSIAYDPQNRLWVAYEASTTKWGKDWGALKTTGVSLYQDHNVRVKCFQGSQAFTTSFRIPQSVAGLARRAGSGRGKQACGSAETARSGYRQEQRSQASTRPCRACR